MIEVLFASNNEGKKKRLESILEYFSIPIKILTPNDLNIDAKETLEDGNLEENALKKALAYKGEVNMPILAGDTGFFIHGEPSNPVTVRRNAVPEDEEKLLSKTEIAGRMQDYYKKIAKDAGGEIDAYWDDAWAVVFPDGNEKIEHSKREVILTDKPKGEIDTNFPVRSLYRVKSTAKYIADQSKDEEMIELSPIAEAMRKLFSVRS
ncbi:MAG: hypothetical protein COV70_00960 [Parcubacteria group bacterium CG11_big_fil_rev_8_21_14_0_20_39_22]|nr:MAG: hypothetical protein COV70_00960 [Parcubacteria group bacterium CG11_big_fil_rev_8_21_14_0_20_39_22]